MSKPQAVVFVGLQAAGKSTYYKENFADTHVRINLDMLRTRNRERALLNACLLSQQSFVIDNTNLTRKHRAFYKELAKLYGFETVCYIFETGVAECVKRNKERKGKKQIPEGAIRSCSRKLQRPDLSEGFDRVFSVRANGMMAEMKKFVMEKDPLLY